MDDRLREAGMIGEPTMQSHSSRRGLFKAIVAALGAWLGIRRATLARAAATELKLPANLPVERFDFETKGTEGWRVVDGRWTVEEMAGAPSGKRVLIQRATQNEFNVIVAAGGPYADADVSVRFKPISGRSEEHTSELQSRLHLVCRLLLEKKKKTRIRSSTSRNTNLVYARVYTIFT